MLNDPLALTRFLTALSHSPQLLTAFKKSPAEAAAPWGLDDEQIALLERGNLNEIQDAVNAEVGQYGGTATVGWWIMVEETQQANAGRLPDWWIRRA